MARKGQEAHASGEHDIGPVFGLKKRYNFTAADTTARAMMMMTIVVCAIIITPSACQCGGSGTPLSRPVKW